MKLDKLRELAGIEIVKEELDADTQAAAQKVADVLWSKTVRVGTSGEDTKRAAERMLKSDIIPAIKARLSHLAKGKGPT